MKKNPLHHQVLKVLLTSAALSLPVLSNAETWNTTKNVVSGIKWMFTPDAPLLFNPSPEIQK